MAPSDDTKYPEESVNNNDDSTKRTDADGTQVAWHGILWHRVINTSSTKVVRKVRTIPCSMQLLLNFESKLIGLHRGLRGFVIIGRQRCHVLENTTSITFYLRYAKEHAWTAEKLWHWSSHNPRTTKTKQLDRMQSIMTNELLGKVSRRKTRQAGRRNGAGIRNSVSTRG